MANYTKCKDNVFQLIDFFTLFHFHFIKGHPIRDTHFWTSIQRTATFYNWAGYMFELLVFSHTRQLKQRLGISGVLTDIYSWRTVNEDNIPGAQIDLVMERQDRTVNICEIKFSEDEYLIDNEYDRILRRKIEAYRRLKVSAKTSIQLTMITTYGLARGKYNGNVQNEVVLDDLFEP